MGIFNLFLSGRLLLQFVLFAIYAAVIMGLLPVKAQAERASQGSHSPSSDSGRTSFDLLRMRPEEIQLLESLDQRRLILDEREASVRRKEDILKVLESRIDQKIENLKSIQSVLKQEIISYEKREDQQMQSLVKIYELMKPNEAAAILSGVDLEILLSILERMKEKGASAILAVMDPIISQKVTTELADRLRINGQLHRNLSP